MPRPTESSVGRCRLVPMGLGESDGRNGVLVEEPSKDARGFEGESREEDGLAFGQGGRPNPDDLGPDQAMQQALMAGLPEDHGHDRRRVEDHVPSGP